MLSVDAGCGEFAANWFDPMRVADDGRWVCTHGVELGGAGYTGSQNFMLNVATYSLPVGLLCATLMSCSKPR